MRSLFVLSVLLFAGCTWVKPTPQSHAIALLAENDVVNCVKKGITTVTTLNKMMFISRNRKKVFSELVMLAKNEAVILQGDSIVPIGEEKEAKIGFTVYKCR